MGGNQSTRQIVIDNTHADVVVTEDVNRRLSGLPERPRGRDVGGESQALSREQVAALRRQMEADYARVLMEKHSETQRVRVEEFAKAVQEVEAKFIKQTGSPVCPELQQKVYECYHDHLRQPLNCAKQVQAFSEAVERERRTSPAHAKKMFAPLTLTLSDTATAVATCVFSAFAEPASNNVYFSRKSDEVQ